MAYRLRYAAHSEIGLIRKNNQDSGLASPHLLVVADGMGGAAAGDLASAVAVDTLRRLETPSDPGAMLEVLAGAIHKANDRIADLVEADLTLDGMGTTVTGALFDGESLGLAHIGDSRAYLLRSGQLQRLTHDHSWVQSLVDEGKISLDEAAMHPHRSLLLKVLNGQAANDPDLSMVSLTDGDRLMFCSDGVCGLVDDREIAEALALPTVEDALERLVSRSLEAGGVDNITAIVADVVPEDGSADSVVLGAAAERDIPAAETRVRDAVVEDEEDEGDTEDTVIRPRPALPADEERYRPQAPHRGRFLRPLVGLVVLLLVAGSGLAVAYAWTRTQYFVGAAGAQVAIFRGLSDGVPGLRLSEVYEVQPLTVAELPVYYQAKVTAGIDVASLDAARQAVAELTEAAQRCAAGRPTASPASPSAGASTTPTAKGSLSASATPSTATTPETGPTASPTQDC